MHQRGLCRYNSLFQCYFITKGMENSYTQTLQQTFQSTHYVLSGLPHKDRHFVVHLIWQSNTPNRYHLLQITQSYYKVRHHLQGITDLTQKNTIYCQNNYSQLEHLSRIKTNKPQYNQIPSSVSSAYISGCKTILAFYISRKSFQFYCWYYYLSLQYDPFAKQWIERNVYTLATPKVT